jgi:hypothetical protein
LPLPVPSVEQVSWWLVLEPGKLKPDEKRFLESLLQVSGQAQETCRLIGELVEIIKRKDEDELTFGVTKDEAAVRHIQFCEHKQNKKLNYIANVY